ncbi:MAG TPA: diacylglycerol kinase family protein [Haloplasmataceae bacterium]
MKYLFAVNPNSGKKKALSRMTELEVLLKKDELDYMIYLTTPTYYAKELRDIIIANGITHVFAVGGDGTAHEVLNAVVGLDVKFGVIPFGSGNDFARTLGIKRSLTDIYAMIKRDRTKKIDIGRFQDRYFLNYLSFGFDVAICRNAYRFRNLIGVAYVLSFFFTLFHFRSRPLIVEGKRDRYAMISIFNGKYFGGGITVNPEGQVDDGKLNLLSLKRTTNFHLFWYFAKMFFGKRLKPSKRVTKKEVETFHFEIEDTLVAGVDGEFYEFNEPFDVSIIPQAVTCIY